MLSLPEQLEQAEYQATQANQIVQKLLSYDSVQSLHFVFYLDDAELDTFYLPIEEHSIWLSIFTTLLIYYRRLVQTLRLQLQANG